MTKVIMIFQLLIDPEFSHLRLMNEIKECAVSQSIHLTSSSSFKLAQEPHFADRHFKIVNKKQISMKEQNKRALYTGDLHLKKNYSSINFQGKRF